MIFTTYDLASRGKNETNKNQCWGVYDDGSSQPIYGPAYQNACVHSGSTEYSGGNTTWYNYTLATAGTIIDENTDSEHPPTNTATATESLCPKGWTLPSRTQTQTIGPSSGSTTYVSIFSPVLGGGYYNGIARDEADNGRWWSSDASNVYTASSRYYLNYTSNKLTTYNRGNRHYGLYIRCVQAS